MIAHVMGCAQGQMSQWGCGNYVGAMFLAHGPSKSPPKRSLRGHPRWFWPGRPGATKAQVLNECLITTSSVSVGAKLVSVRLRGRLAKSWLRFQHRSGEEHVQNARRRRS